MYYPITIPDILVDSYDDYISYKETIIPTLKDFVICFWETQPVIQENKEISHIILFDGGIDLVVDYDNQEIYYAGMSKTVFDLTFHNTNRHFGVRLKPGAFHQLTGFSAKRAMDVLLPIHETDSTFDEEYLFSKTFEEAKIHMKNYLENLTEGKTPNKFVKLFDDFYLSPPDHTKTLSEHFFLSARQLQRAFAKNFGLTPKIILSVLRFQKCLTILSAKDARPVDVLNAINYYDQTHFIKDFKKHIGFTPLELIKRMQS
ncbi:MAG: helix-turn-helix domain-containing protein [Streptococcaceae bacterium]|jgi:hypothetical protein|nr:helix-turn-helix domain-containing protein [Streptococcaceae bacterium]